MTFLEFRRMMRELTIDHKPRLYTSLGCYPLYLVMADGGSMCPKCAREERAQIALATITNARDGWACLGVEINYEDPDMICCNCNERIESAYAEPERAVCSETGYTACACRDCMEIAIGTKGAPVPMCSECQEAGCDPTGESDCACEPEIDE